MAKSTQVISQPAIKFSFSDFVALTKPRIVALLLLTTLVPMFLAEGGPPSFALIMWTMLGGFLAAGGANALNQYVDRDIDNIMPRTRRRPLPSSRMEPGSALWFGIIVSAISFVQLWLTVNLLTALLALSGIVFYVFVYTLVLKRSTTQNIVIGGAAGAIPPLVGWAAVANNISLLPIFMFLIVFYWTPPHFWAIALIRLKDYGAAGVPMLPVIVGERETHRQMVIYSVLLAVVSIVPVFLHLLGPVYLVCAVIFNGIFLWQVVDLYRDPSSKHIWRLYMYSLVYLAVLFLAMGIDGLFFQIPEQMLQFSLKLPF